MSFQVCTYLDYASTHPRRDEILALRAEFERTSYANIGRAHYDRAEQSMIAYHASKKIVAEWIGCESVEVLYTYSATYALNLLALAVEHNGVVGKGDTILLSVSEHHANIVPLQMLAERVWAHVRFVSLDSQYRLDLEDLRSKLDDSVKVVSLQYASNVTGAIHPLEKVREIIGTERLFCVDAAQMVLHGPIDMKQLGCDAMVFSWHKIGADTGIGVLALWKILQKSWESPVSGGGAINFVTQEWYEQAGIPDKWEPGTPHITGAVTLGAAIEYLQKIDQSQRDNYRALVAYVDEQFSSLGHTGIQVFHSTSDALGVWSFALPDRHPSDIADILAQSGICVRSGHHCCQPLHDSLHVSGTVRISIGYETTRKEMEHFFAILATLI